MKLGKRFARLKRCYNAATISMTFTKDDGTVVKPHRKLNMLLVLSIYMRVNKNAVKKEFQKMKRKYGNEEK